jgi:hypothetical protein
MLSLGGHLLVLKHSASAATTRPTTKPARSSVSNTPDWRPIRARGGIMTQVRVEQGILEGNQKRGVFRFRGVPYAAPPVGDLRWAAPAPPHT